MKKKSIYHLARKAEWRAAQETGLYEGSAEDRADGFLHFSTAEQIVESATRHRAGEKELCLLRAHAEDCGDALRWETSRSGQLFPHLYGELRLELVLQCEELPLDEGGLHVFPRLDE